MVKVFLTIRTKFEDLMSNLPLIDPATATGATAELLATVQANLGITPNMTKAMANSPAVLKSYLEFSGALAGGTLRPAVREQLALAIAQSNTCAYCLSAHTYIGEHVAKLSADDIAHARQAKASDPKIAALLRFAVAINVGHGTISRDDVANVHQAGATDAEIAETIAHVALNVLTNYFNKAADVDIDFPLVQA
jgi:uncharacterized peroxidase-related enzyme